MSMTQFVSLFQAAIVFGTVILYGAMGEILTEKSGNLNLGVPGIMYLGGIAGLAASFFYELNNPAPNPAVCLLLSFLAAFAAAALGGLLFLLLLFAAADAVLRLLGRELLFVFTGYFLAAAGFMNYFLAISLLLSLCSLLLSFLFRPLCRR